MAAEHGHQPIALPPVEWWAAVMVAQIWDVSLLKPTPSAEEQAVRRCVLFLGQQ